jgi:prepilin-type N-terminal cleavage/methylation domain-containing protein
MAGSTAHMPVASERLGTRGSRLRRAGFTIAELLAVLVMIGILSAIAVSRVKITRIRAKAAALTFGNALMAVQREAIVRQHNMLVVLNSGSRSVRIVYDSTNDLTLNNNERTRAFELGEGMVFGLPGGVTARAFGNSAINFPTNEASTGLPAIVFYRNGAARDYGGLYISTSAAMAGAADHKDETWAIELTRATGRAEWYNWNGTSWVRGF